MAGRPKKPTGLQATAPGGCPDKPSGLSEIASLEWDLLVGELSELGTVSSVDRAVITMAAVYAGYFADAAADVQQHGLTLDTKTGKKAHPSLRARDDAARIRKAYLEALGLTPASRSRVSTPAPDSAPSLEDVLDGDGTVGSAERMRVEKAQAKNANRL